MITLTIPNDDHIALRAFGKALEEMALAHGAEPHKTTVGEMSFKLDIDTTEALERLNTATAELMKAAPRMMREARFDGEELQGKRKEPEIDTTAQQVESLGATHIITEQKLVGEPVPVGDGNFSQGYIATVEEIADPVDSTGTPWDERIHSASKALNADGTWRLRRKPKDMDEADWSDYVSMIKADLQYPVECDGEKEETEQSFDVEQQPINLDHVSIDPAHDKDDETAELTVEPPVTPPGDDFHTDAGVVTEQTVAGIPPIPVPPPVALPGSTGATDLLPPAPIPTAVPTLVDWTFPKLMTFLTERQGKIDVVTVNMLLAQDGIVSLPELNAHPDKIGPFVARVKAHLGE